MKKFRKLIPALCMLLVSALFVGTSTYAWFSMNTTVTATNMQVTAKSNATYLLIDTADNGTNKDTSATTKETNAAAATVYPCAYTANEIADDTDNTNKIEAKTWYTANNKNGDNATNAVLGRKTIALGNGDYMQKSEFWLTLSKDSEPASNKTLSIAFEKAAGDDAAISTAVFVGDAQEPILLNDTTTQGAATVSLTSTTSVKVTVYTYIDGTSANVNSDYFNAAATANKLQGTVKLTFDLGI